MERRWKRIIARTFRSLRHRNYAYYFSGQFVSFTGSWMQSAAMMWLVYDHTSEVFWPPLLLVAAVGPTLFLGPVGGAIADRYPKKTVIFLTQFAFLISAVLLTALVLAGVIDPVLFLVLQLINGIVQAIDLPARLAFVPDLIPRSDLINAVGLNSLTFNLARALGPALAGVIFILVRLLDSDLPTVRLGAVFCFGVNAVSYVAVLLALSNIHLPPSVPHHERAASRFWDGLLFLKSKPGLAGLVIITGVLSVFGWPMLTLLPAYTRDVLGMAERAYSFLLSALGAGALLASLFTASSGNPQQREKVLVLGAFISLVGLTGLLVAESPLLAVPSCMLFGFGLILYLSTGQSTMQLDSPDRARGKVMAFWAMTLSGSAIPGHLAAGWAARTCPLRSVIFVMVLGVAVSLIGLIVLVMTGALRHRDNTMTQETEKPS